MNRSHNLVEVAKSRSMYSSPETLSESDSEAADPQEELLRLREYTRRLRTDKEEWMQKYYSLLTAQEIKERLVAETLENVESEIRKLNGKVHDLQRENKGLRTEVEDLRAAHRETDAHLAAVQSRWRQEKDAWQQTLAREREACSDELAEIATQFQKIKRQFIKHQEREDPRQAAFLKKIHNLESQNARFRRENLEMKRGMGTLRKELSQLHGSSTRLAKSACVLHSRSVPGSKRSHSRGRRVSQQDRSPEQETSIEDMLAHVEARLHRAKELVLDEPPSHDQ